MGILNCFFGKKETPNITLQTDPITMAIVGALTIGVKKVGESLIPEAYEHLKTVLRNKFGERLEGTKLLEAVEDLEQEPKDDVTKNTLVGRIAQVQADKDTEILEAVKKLLEAIKNDPNTATITGVSLEEVKAWSLTIDNVISTGKAVDIRKSEFQRDMKILNANAGGTNEHKATRVANHDNPTAKNGSRVNIEGNEVGGSISVIDRFIGKYVDNKWFAVAAIIFFVILILFFLIAYYFLDPKKQYVSLLVYYLPPVLIFFIILSTLRALGRNWVESTSLSVISLALFIPYVYLVKNIFIDTKQTDKDNIYNLSGNIIIDNGELKTDTKLFLYTNNADRIEIPIYTNGHYFVPNVASNLSYTLEVKSSDYKFIPPKRNFFNISSNQASVDFVGLRIEPTQPLVEFTDIDSSLDGIVDWVVDKGKTVEKGEIIARLKCKYLNAEYKAAVVAVQNATTILNYINSNISSLQSISKVRVDAANLHLLEMEAFYSRMQLLYKEGAISLSKLDEAKSKKGEAQAALEIATEQSVIDRRGYEPLVKAEAEKRMAEEQLNITKTQLEKCEIQSPVKGIVLESYVQPGQRVGSSYKQPLVRIKWIN